MPSFNWVCPYCGRAQTVVDSSHSTLTNSVGVTGIADGPLVLERNSIACANPDCRKLTLSVRVGVDDDRHGQGWHIDPRKPLILSQRLLPPSAAKPQPEFIPKVLVEDYVEACLICDLSPKAAATLSRRCLQGMIRDFCGISKGRLIDEINALREAVASGTVDRAVTDESVKAIDHVRSIGNIGAHMERDIDVIVPVDAGEARTLIELIEMLFEEWYVARQVRQERLERLERIAADKKTVKVKGSGTLGAPMLALGTGSTTGNVTSGTGSSESS
jgi:Domain of unknown function (DUF4145)